MQLSRLAFFGVFSLLLCAASSATAQATISITTPAPATPPVVVIPPGVVIVGNVSGGFGDTFPDQILITVYDPNDAVVYSTLISVSYAWPWSLS